MNNQHEGKNNKILGPKAIIIISNALIARGLQFVAADDKD